MALDSKTLSAIDDLLDLLLPDEDDEHFYHLFVIIGDELQPKDGIEKLWVRDLVLGRWDIYRYQRHKAQIVSVNMKPALRSLLVKLHLDTSMVNAEGYAHSEAGILMDKFGRDENGQAAVYAFLAKHGLSKETVKAEAFATSAALIENIDRKIRMLKRDEVWLVRELGIRREFARRAARLCDEHIPSEATATIEPKKKE